MSTSMLERIKPLVPPGAQHKLGRARLGIRTRTSGLRVLPDFLVIGAQRGGTGSLYKYLTQHPHILSPLHKEVQFFSRKFGMGVNWYRSHFPLQIHKDYVSQVRRARVLTFEATPNYVFHPHVAKRVHGLIPEAKFVVLLRNPIDRAISHYRLSLLLGIETLPLEQALEEEPARLARDIEAMAAEPLHDGRDFLNFSYVARGVYVDQLKMWMDLFAREQILVVKSEQLFEDPGATYQQVLGFLGLASWEPSEFRAHGTRTSVGIEGTSRSVADDTRQMLREVFRPHNQRLYDLLDTDLGWDS